MLYVRPHDVDIQLGDNGGVNLFRIYDSTPAIVASVNSDGRGYFASTVQVIEVNGNIAGAPTQAEMVAAFGAAVSGRIGVYGDTNGAGVAYLCFADTVAGAGAGWFQLAGVLGL